MSPAGRAGRAGRLLRAGAVAAAALATVLLPGVTTGGASAAPGSDVTLQAVGFSPAVPVISQKPQALTVHLQLTNDSDRNLTHVTISAQRGVPIGSQSTLNDSFAANSIDTGSGLPVPASKPVTVSVPAGTTTTVAFRTVTGLADDGTGICLCADAVYPLDFTAHVSTGGQDEVVAATRTYLPVFKEAVDPVQVAWVWPLLDRPHRLAQSSVFTDDALARSVSPGGRLDRALQVLEALPAGLPVTIVTDPDLLDELETMASGDYTVQPLGSSKATKGTGAAAAKAWLDRFTRLLTTNQSLEVSLTPYADPDVQALAQHRLTWSTVQPKAMAQNVRRALAGRVPVSDVSWPPGGVVGARTLNALARSGTSTALLQSNAVATRTTATKLTESVARLRTSSGPVTAGLLDSTEGKLVDAAIAPDSANDASERLISEIALRADKNTADNTTGGTTGGTPVPAAAYRLLAPARYVDPAVAAAVKLITLTSTSAYTRPTSVQGLTAGRPARPVRLTGRATGLPPQLIRTARYADRTVPTILAMIGDHPDSAAQDLADGLPEAIQRVTSGAWRPAETDEFGRRGLAYGAALREQIRSLVDGVRIVKPSSGYTLGSQDSSLPVTIENQLPFPVTVDVNVSTQNGLPGYQSGKVKPQTIAASSKQTVQVPSHVDRSGPLKLKAQLLSPNGVALGSPVPFSVRATIFGTVGLIITVGAGAVLVAALLVRLINQLRRRKPPAGPAPAPQGELHEVGT